MNTVTQGNVLTNLQRVKLLGIVQDMLNPSITVRGREVADNKSQIARLKMKMFRGVLKSFFLQKARITPMFPRTAKIPTMKYKMTRTLYMGSLTDFLSGKNASSNCSTFSSSDTKVMFITSSSSNSSNIMLS